MADAQVSVRDLRNHGGDVLDRVEVGEALTVTRSGKPVARLVPLRQRGLTSAVLVERWRNLPLIDATRFRADIDAVIEDTL
jgi:prevent-host-death family protein